MKTVRRKMLALPVRESTRFGGVRAGAHKVCALLILLALTAASARAQDITIVKGRLYASYLNEGAKNHTTIQGYLDTIAANGSWPDINYNDESRNVWDPANHLYRIEDMAKAYRTVGHTDYNSAAVQTACSNALNYWYSRDPHSDNWWWNEIGPQLTLSKSLILLESTLTPSQITSGCNILNRSQPTDTGQNLVWEAGNQTIKGLLQNNASTVTTSLNYITSTIVITTAEGVQPDYSFQQHGPILYSGGYGAGFSANCGFWASMTTGTTFGFSAAKIDILSSHLLDGQRWMTRGRMFDYGVHGRGITRKDITGWEIVAPSLQMAGLHTPRESEFMALYNQLTLTTPPTSPAVIGNKHFWHSDYMSHSRSNYMMSTRMYSTRNYNTDGEDDGGTVNGEGKRSHHIADGCTFIFRDGEEYTNIFGVWDWYRIPGTTVDYGGSLNPNQVKLLGTKSFVGGCSDGTYGLAAMDFSHSPVNAKKSWFYFDNEIVCLGAGISSTGANSVYTNLNQCLLRGPVTVKDSVGTRTLSNGDWTLNGLQWAHQDNVGYVLPTASSARLKNQSQSQSWNYINDVYPAAEIDTKDVFSLWLDHGAAVSNGSYQYIVVPAVTSTQLGTYALSPPVSIRSNTSSVQAVQQTALGITQASFFSPGSMTGADGLIVTADKACLAMLRRSGNQYIVSASNPANASLALNIDVNRYLTGTNATWMPGSLTTRLAFSLPSGNDAGKSIVQTFNQIASATNPSPAIGATLVSPSVVLSWTAAAGTSGHQIYLGTSSSAVSAATTASPEFLGTLGAATISIDPPGQLQEGVTYYWRVDEVPPVGPAVAGPVWNFSTLIIPADLDNDLDVDQSDYGKFQLCISGREAPYALGCNRSDLDVDGDVDQTDMTKFLNCMKGPDQPPDLNCLAN